MVRALRQAEAPILAHKGSNMTKRLFSFGVLALAAATTFATAQDVESVLEKTRERYRRAIEAQEESRIEAVETGNVAYTPFVLSLVPGLAFPFGYYDTSISLAAVGAMDRDIDGVQAASVFAMARDVEGFQQSGVFAMASEVRGVQMSGVFNIASKVRGGQLGGVFNIAEDSSSVQAAGVFNIAEKLNGIQVAGVFNIAEDAKGIQIGLVNIADRMDGVQIGLVNIAQDGVTGFGLAGSTRDGLVEFWWQNGTRTLYTVFTAELPFNDLFVTANDLALGAGLGTRIGGRWHDPYLDVEILAASLVGPELHKLPDLMECSTPAPDWNAPVYPELRLRLGLPLGGLDLVGGLVADFEIDGLQPFPETRRTGHGQTFGQILPGTTAYTRWFLGVKI